MAKTKFQLAVNIIANTDDLQKGLKDARSQLKTSLGGWKNVDFATNLAEGFALVSAAALGAGATMVKVAGDAKAMRIAFNSLTGDVDRASRLWDEMNDFAVATPFDVRGVQEAAKKMLAYGVAVDDIIPRLRILGDTAAAVGMGSEGINRITVALGQMNAMGKITRGDLNQLVAVGINVWEILSEKLGKSVPEVMDMVSKSALDSKTGIEALLAGMEERYGGLMKELEGTTSQSLNAIMESFYVLSVEIGQQLTDALSIDVYLKELADGVSEFSDSVRKNGIGETLDSMIPAEFIAAAGTLGAIVLPALIAGFSNLALKGVMVAATGFGTLTAAITGLPATIMALATGVKTLSIAFVGLATNPVVLGITAIGVAAYACYEGMKYLDEATKDLDPKFRSLSAAAKSSSETIQQVVADNEEFADALKNVADNSGRAAQSVADYRASVDDAAIAAEAAKVSSSDLGVAIVDLSGELDKIIDKSSMSEDAFNDLSSSEQQLREDFGNGVIQLEEYYQELLKLRDAALNARNAFSGESGWMSSGSSDDYDLFTEGSIGQKIMMGELDASGNPIKKKTSTPVNTTSTATGGSKSGGGEDPAKKEDELTSKTIDEIAKRAQAQTEYTNLNKKLIDDRVSYEQNLVGLSTNTLAKDTQERIAAQANLYNELSTLDANYLTMRQSYMDQLTQANLLNDEELKNSTIERINEEMNAEQAQYETEKAHLQELMNLEAARYAALPEYQQKAYSTMAGILEDFYNTQMEYNTMLQEAEAARSAAKQAMNAAEYAQWEENFNAQWEQEQVKYAQDMEQMAAKAEMEQMHYEWRMEQEQGLQELGQQFIQNSINGLGQMILQGQSFGQIMQQALKTAVSGIINMYATMLAKQAIQQKTSLGDIMKQAAALKAATASVLPGLTAAAVAYATLHPSAPAIAEANLTASTTSSIGILKGLAGLATGGLVTGPTLSLVGEGSSDEMVMPLNNKTLGRFASNLSEFLYSDSGASVNTEINLYGDISTDRDYTTVLNDINEAVASGLRGAK